MRRHSIRVLLVIFVALTGVTAGCAGLTADGTQDAAGRTVTPTPTTTSEPTSTPTSPTATTPAPTLSGPRAEVVQLSLDKGRVTTGESFTLTIRMRNIGDAAAKGTLNVLVEGAPVSAWEFTVPAQDLTQLHVPLSVQKEGRHLISVYAVGAEVIVGPVEVDVTPPGALRLSNVTVAPPIMDLGDVARISVDVLNTGGTRSTGQVLFSVGGITLGNGRAELESEASMTVTAPVTPTKAGTLPVRAFLQSGSAEATGTITVRGPEFTNATATFNSEFCVGRLSYSVSVYNAGTGDGRETTVTAIVYDVNGTEHSRATTDPQRVPAYERVAFHVAPPVTNGCRTDETYQAKFIITPRFGTSITIEAAAVTV